MRSSDDFQRGYDLGRRMTRSVTDTSALRGAAREILAWARGQGEGDPFAAGVALAYLERAVEVDRGRP